MNRLTRELTSLRGRLEAAGIPAPEPSTAPGSQTPRSPSRSPSRASSLSRRSISGANSPRSPTPQITHPPIRSVVSLGRVFALTLQVESSGWEFVAWGSPDDVPGSTTRQHRIERQSKYRQLGQRRQPRRRTSTTWPRTRHRLPQIRKRRSQKISSRIG